MAKRSTIERQINTILYSKQAFGESRHEAKAELREMLGDNFRFGMSDDKIHSYTTFATYKDACQRFGKWLVEEKGINKRDDVKNCKQYVKEFIHGRLDQGLSVWTVKMERSALGKLYGETIQIEMPKREIKNIIRSRGEKASDRNFSEDKNRDLVDICRATGGRREDIEKMKPSDFRFDTKGNLWVDIDKSKGGRFRTVPIIPSYQNRVIEIIRDLPKDNKIFDVVKGHADIHSYRGEYARALYDAVAGDKALRDSILRVYPTRHEYKTIRDKETGERQTYEIKSKTITTRRGAESQTYNRDDVYCVSQALGHNRLDVTLSHYFR